MLGTVLPDGTRIDEALDRGTWSLYRGTARDGARVLVTIVPQPPPEPSPAIVARDLALPFAGVPALRAIVDVEQPSPHRALVEDAPAGTRISELPALALDDVVAVARDLARLLAAIHAAGSVLGDLRPQTTFVERVAGRLTLTGTTPRCARFGAPLMSPTRTGTYSPFLHDMFVPDLVVRGHAPSAATDVAQLGMLIERMATGRSPFVDPSGSVVTPFALAMTGDSPPWNLDAPRACALEALAKAAFHPSSGPDRELAPLRAFLEHAA